MHRNKGDVIYDARDTTRGRGSRENPLCHTKKSFNCARIYIFRCVLSRGDLEIGIGIFIRNLPLQVLYRVSSTATLTI